MSALAIGPFKCGRLLSSANASKTPNVLGPRTFIQPGPRTPEMWLTFSGYESR